MTDTYQKSDLDFFLFSLVERELCSHCLDRCWDFGGFYEFKERLVSSPSHASFYCNIFVTDNTPCYRRTMPSSIPYTEALYQQMTADRNLTDLLPHRSVSPCIWFKPPFSKVISVLASLGAPVIPDFSHPRCAISSRAISQLLYSPGPHHLGPWSLHVPSPPTQPLPTSEAAGGGGGGTHRYFHATAVAKTISINQRETAPAAFLPPSLSVWLVKPRQTVLLAS